MYDRLSGPSKGVKAFWGAEDDVLTEQMVRGVEEAHATPSADPDPTNHPKPTPNPDRDPNPIPNPGARL